MDPRFSVPMETNEDSNIPDQPQSVPSSPTKEDTSPFKAVPLEYYESFGMGLLIVIHEKDKIGETYFEKDRKMSVEFFQTVLGFKVMEYGDGKDLLKFLDEVKNYVKLNPSEHYCLFFLISCHGDEETFIIGDNRMKFKDMRKMFQNGDLADFAGCPKIFIADFCRGGSVEKAVPKSCAAPSVPIQELFVNVDADIMVVYATTQGKTAFMTRNGSLLHKVLIDILRRHWKNSSLQDMVLHVQYQVGKWAGEADQRQTVELISTLTKTFAFKGAKIKSACASCLTKDS